MSDTYTKLFSSITESTVWGESYATRIVWVTLLAMADAQGDVHASIPGLARRGNVTVPEVEDALLSFLSPDAYSRTKDEDGRRIEEIDGGWHLINHGKYSAVRSAEERREYKRKWDRENRSSGHARTKAVRQESDSSPTRPDSPAPSTPTPTPEEQKQEPARATPAGFACKAMKDAGCVRVNPSHPDLLAALEEGVIPKELADAVREALDAGKSNPFPWAIATARGRHAEGPKPAPLHGACHENSRRLSASEQTRAAIAARRERESVDAVL